MALLVVQQPHTRICLSGDALVVRQRRVALETTPLQRIDEVHLFGPVELTAPARSALLKARIDVLCFSARGRYLGRIEPIRARSGQRRLGQLERMKADGLSWARSVVRAKLWNQRQLLVRASRRPGDTALRGAIVALAGLGHRVEQVEDVGVLRGIEGQAAAVYFRGLAQAIRNDRFEFPRRSRRPPRDPFNACLSFSYMFWLARLESAVRAAGLDPLIGALHVSEGSRPAFALDAFEPLRPFIDRVVLTLVNRGQLDPADFVEPGVDASSAASPEEPPPPGSAVHVGPLARPTLIRALARAWRGSIPTSNQREQLDRYLKRWLGAVGLWCEGAGDLPQPPRMSR